jgi:prevent-host-death family protein
MTASWSVQDAKARFSELLETCLREGPQLVTKRGVEAAVLVPKSEWDRLQRAARPSLKELLLAPQPRTEFEPPQRGRLRRRRGPVFVSRDDRRIAGGRRNHP